MLSKEAKDSIKMIRSMKESQKDSLKAELVPDIRKNTDKQITGGSGFVSQFENFLDFFMYSEICSWKDAAQ